MEFQTRSEENGICYHNTLKEALEESRKDKTVWKISFTYMSERIRLVRYTDDNKWILASLLK